MAAYEPGQEQILKQMHDQVAVYVKQLDDLMRELTEEQAVTLVDDAQHLLTVVTFLRDATVDLLEAAGLRAGTDEAPLDADGDGASGPIEAE
jgi:hypothetical protein